MDDRIKLSYFYGKEAEQYLFYKIPKLLFTDDYFKKISVISKLISHNYVLPCSLHLPEIPQ